MITWIFEVLALVVIIAVIVWKVRPPVQTAMRKQQDLIAQQIEDSRQAKARLAEAEEKYANALTEARTEAAKVRDTARADAERIVEEMREQANAEVERIKQRGREQMELEQQRMMRELRERVGTLSSQLAERLVQQHLADESNRRATVDSVLDELEGMSAKDETVASGRSEA